MFQFESEEILQFAFGLFGKISYPHQNQFFLFGLKLDLYWISDNVSHQNIFDIIINFV